MIEDWKPYAERLADELTRSGIITDPALHKAVVNVPRHLFLPEFYAGRNGDDPIGRYYTEGSDGYLETVYSDMTLVTRHAEHRGWTWAVSSSTAPSLMLRMLHALDLLDAMKVLEIGTGTGYNAALLSERLGDRMVSSIDIDAGVISQAYRQLKAAGYDPVLGCRDGRNGYPDRAPYDRLIATVAFDYVPYTWVQQVRQGGVILADVRPPGATWAGALARLTVKADGSATGPLLECRAGFMPARTDPMIPGIADTPGIDKTTVHQRYTGVPGEALTLDGLALALWAALPGLSVFPGRDTVTLVAQDGSWAEVARQGASRFSYGGPSDVWTVVESVRSKWLGWGSPGPDRFGLTVTPEGQRLWLDDPNKQI